MPTICTWCLCLLCIRACGLVQNRCANAGNILSTNPRSILTNTTTIHDNKLISCNTEHDTQDSALDNPPYNIKASERSPPSDDINLLGPATVDLAILLCVTNSHICNRSAAAAAIVPLTAFVSDIHRTPRGESRIYAHPRSLASAVTTLGIHMMLYRKQT